MPVLVLTFSVLVLLVLVLELFARELVSATVELVDVEDPTDAEGGCGTVGTFWIFVWVSSLDSTRDTFCKLPMLDVCEVVRCEDNRLRLLDQLQVTHRGKF